MSKISELSARIHLEFLPIDKHSSLFDLLSTRCSKLLIVEESGDKRPHWHLCMVTRFSMKTIRTDIKKYLTNKSHNNRFQVKNANGKSQTYVRALQYICKGKSDQDLPNIIKSKGYTQNDIKDFHKAYWLENSGLKKKGSLKGLPGYVKISEDLLLINSLINPIKDHLCKKTLQEFIKKIKLNVVKYYIKNYKTFPTNSQLDCVCHSCIGYILSKLTYHEDDVASICVAIISNTLYNVNSEFQTQSFIDKNL